jgi:hypothetical protein
MRDILAHGCHGKGGHGYNAQTDKFEDLFESGVIDPTNVARSVLQNAASVASLLTGAYERPCSARNISAKSEKDTEEESMPSNSYLIGKPVVISKTISPRSTVPTL